MVGRDGSSSEVIREGKVEKIKRQMEKCQDRLMSPEKREIVQNFI
ncbi:MAG: hypothetical protein ACUVR0_10145 [Candidatus Aminicenantales bacterium]